MFGRLLKLVSLCSAAFLWTRMAENMLSNRAGAAQKWVKQSRQAAVTTDRWVLHSNTHSHTHTGTYALCLFLLVALPQSRRGVQSNSCMETLHAHNADGRSLCASTCNRLHRVHLSTVNASPHILSPSPPSCAPLQSNVTAPHSPFLIVLISSSLNLLSLFIHSPLPSCIPRRLRYFLPRRNEGQPVCANIPARHKNGHRGGTVITIVKVSWENGERNNRAKRRCKK